MGKDNRRLSAKQTADGRIIVSVSGAPFMILSENFYDTLPQEVINKLNIQPTSDLNPTIPPENKLRSG